MATSPTPPGASPPSPTELDPRVHAYRPDLADAALRGRVEAARFVEPVARVCCCNRETVRVEPLDTARACSELLWGELFLVLEDREGWSWGWCAHDGYVGFVKSDSLLEPVTLGGEPNYRVAARTALGFSDADIKSATVGRYPMGALLHVGEWSGAFARSTAAWVHARHLTPLGEHAADPVEVASRLLGAPYLWGGRTGDGIDCSGLVQVALNLCGLACPRDSDQQRAALGVEVAPDDLRRGDLVFFPGHVGFMVDGDRLLHANAHWMGTVVEPLADVVERLRPKHAEPILAVKRM